MTSAKKWRRFYAAVVCAAAATPRPAAALDHIDHESWTVTPALLPPAPEVARVSLTFDAIVTLQDIWNYTAFGVVAQDAHGEENALVSWQSGGMSNLPPIGTPVHVDATFFIECESMWDGVSARAGEAWVRWYSGVYERRTLLPSGSDLSAPFSGPFGLAVAGREGARGPHPMPRRALACNRPHPSIGIYFDPQGSVCQGTIRPGSPGRIYVLAKLDPAMGPGAAGAEFRFTGIPAAWRTFPTASPDVLALGNPFATGVAMGFACQSPASGVLTLYEVEVVATDEVPDVQFGIAARTPPTQPHFDCPFVIGCDDPVFTKYCVEARPCFVNTSVPKPCGGLDAVTPRTWSQVKATYR